MILMNTRRVRRIAFMIALLPLPSQAACKWVWVDHDYNSSTPAIRKQVCDSAIDIPAINTPSIRPLQTPSIRPLPSLGLPPIGTTRCRNERVYENGQWINKRICS